MQRVPLKNHTAVGIGGEAKYFEIAENPNDLIRFTKVAIAQNMPYFILGGGSNTLFGDHGFPGLVIKNQSQGIKIKDEIITCQSGTTLSELVVFTVDHRFAGLQNMIGIPGTVGGAIFGNAAAFGQAIGDHIVEVVCFDPSASPLTPGIAALKKAECKFDYRDSAFKKNKCVILEARFKLPKKNKEILKKEMAETMAKRAENYNFTAPNPGSFFKNVPIEKVQKKYLPLIPKNKIKFGKIPAGYLLEQVGAKGKRLGDVQVSSHANILVNLGKGKTSDFVKLAESLAKKVKEGFGIDLEPEVQLP